MTTTSLDHDPANDTRLADANKLLRELGRQSAHSALAKPKMALAIAQARADGVIDDDAGASTFDTYLEGRRSVLAKSALGAGDDGGSYKSNVSKNTQIIKAAGLVTAGIDFVNVLERATSVREGLVKADEKVKPTFDVYVDCARAQLKAPENALTDDEITTIARKPEKAEKELVQKLVDDYKRIYKRSEEFPCQPLADAVTAIGQAIVEAGGEVPPMTDDEKKEAEVMAFIASKGYGLIRNGEHVEAPAAE